MGRGVPAMYGAAMRAHGTGLALPCGLVKNTKLTNGLDAKTQASASNGARDACVAAGELRPWHRARGIDVESRCLAQP
jgi:hypothetical protein